MWGALALQAFPGKLVQGLGFRRAQQTLNPKLEIPLGVFRVRLGERRGRFWFGGSC